MIVVEGIVAAFGEQQNEEPIVSQIVDAGILLKSASFAPPAGLAYSIAVKEFRIDGTGRRLSSRTTPRRWNVRDSIPDCLYF